MESEKNKLLREEAIRRLKEKGVGIEALPLEDVASIIHELQVHQIELEIQNEELRKTQQELIASRNRFLKLFHSAPVGYAILDETGLIEETNETFCKMVGRNADSLKGKAFANFLTEEGSKIFLGRYRAFYKDPKDKIIITDIITSSGNKIAVRLEGSQVDFKFDDRSDGDYRVLIAISDITEQQRAEAEILKRQKKNEALLIAARAVLENQQFYQSAKIIISLCKDLTGATAGYVALFSSDCYENEIVFVDSQNNHIVKKTSQRIPFCDMHEVVYRERRVMFNNNFVRNNCTEFVHDGNLKFYNVLCGPLILQGNAIGVLGLANKWGGFTEDDANIVEDFSDIVTIALVNRRNIESLEASIKEREVLLKELQHRVKNNLAMISGLITLEAEHLNDEKVKTAMWKVRERVDMLSRLYDMLYVSGDVRNIRLDEFILNLVNSLIKSLAGTAIQLETNVEPIIVSTKSATLWGIIVNELVINSIKYAFKDSRIGKITIELTQNQGNIMLTIADDGTGIHPYLNPEVPKGFGTLLVELLIKQLRGKIKITKNCGIAVTIEAPADWS